MNRRWGAAFAIVAAMALAGCTDPEAPPTAETEPFVPAGESLLSLARGAVVVHRTGEQMLETSAALAIDGDPATFWATPPGDLEESMIVALPGEAEIRRVGVSTGAVGAAHAPGLVRFEASVNGETFTPVGIVRVEKEGDAWVDIDPVRASFLRVATVEPFRDSAGSIRVAEALAAGVATAGARPALDGTWEINGMPALMRTEGSTIRGMVASAPPMSLEGGWSGRVVRLTWARGAERGVAGLVPAPTGSHLNAILWHVEPHPPFFWTTWFGRRSGTPPANATLRDPMHAYLEGEGRYPLYGLAFDGTRLAPGIGPAVARLARLIGSNAPGRFRLVAYYASEGTEEDDMRITRERLDALRAALERAGADPARAAFVPRGRAALLDADDLPWSPLQVILNNRIDLELADERPDGDR